MTAAGIVSLILAAAGLIIMIISLIGLIRFPDFFTRLHIQGVGDTLGALLIILGMMTATGAHLMTIKIFLIFLVIMLTNPVGTNLMMIAAIFDKNYQAYTWTRPENKPHDTDLPHETDIAHSTDISKTEIEKPAVIETDKPEIQDADIKTDSGKKHRSGRPKPSMKKTRAELVEIAEGMGINVPDHATKKGILELIYQEKPELRPEKPGTGKSGSKQSGSNKSGTGKSGSKQSGSNKSGSKNSGSDRASSKRSSAKNNNSGNSSKTNSKKSADKNNSKKDTDKSNSKNNNNADRNNSTNNSKSSSKNNSNRSSNKKRNSNRSKSNNADGRAGGSNRKTGPDSNVNNGNNNKKRDGKAGSSNNNSKSSDNNS